MPQEKHQKTKETPGWVQPWDVCFSKSYACFVLCFFVVVVVLWGFLLLLLFCAFKTWTRYVSQTCLELAM
jgi:hypothetical protein